MLPCKVQNNLLTAATTINNMSADRKEDLTVIQQLKLEFGLMVRVVRIHTNCNYRHRGVHRFWGFGFGLVAGFL